MPFDPDKYLSKKSNKESFNPDDYLKKKEDTKVSSTDSLEVAEPSIESGVLDSKTNSKIKGLGDSAVSEATDIEKYIAEKDKGEEPFVSKIGAAFSSEKFDTPREDIQEIPEEQKKVKEVEKRKKVDEDKRKLYTSLDRISTYGKESSRKQLYNMSEDELEDYRSSLIDKGLHPDAVDEAINEAKTQFKKERDVVIVSDLKKKSKEELINKAINKTIDASKYEAQIFKRGEEPGIIQPLGFTPKKATIFQKLNEEDKKKVIAEAEKEYNANIDIKSYSLLSEDDRILAKNNAEFQSVSEQLKEELAKEEGANEKKTIELKEKLNELEIQRRSLGARDRLYNPFTGQTIDRDKATPEIIEYNDKVKQIKSSLTDKDITKKVLEDNLIKLEYFQNKLDEKIPNYEHITYRDLLNPATRMKYQFIDERTEKEAFKLRDEFLDAGAKSQALASAIHTNQDPAAIKRGLFREAGGSEAFGRGLSEAIDLRSRLTDLDKGEIATKFVEAMQEAEQNNVLTKKQIENAKDTFGEKLTYGTGASIPTMAGIIASSMLLESGAGALGAARGLVKMRGLIESVVKSKKAASLITNMVKEGAKGAITFAPTSETALTGTIEGITQSLLPKDMFKGNKYGKILEYATRILAGTVTETPSELSGMYVQNMADNGWDSEAAFERTFGREPKEIWETLALTVSQSAMMSGAFNLPVLAASSKGLKQEIAKGNVPKEDLEAAQELVNIADERLASENPKTVTIKSGEKSDVVPLDEFREKLNDADFIKSVAEGEVAIDISQVSEISNTLGEKIEEYKLEKEIYDSENETRLPSEEPTGEEFIEEQPIQETSEEKIETGRAIQEAKEIPTREEYVAKVKEELAKEGIEEGSMEYNMQMQLSESRYNKLEENNKKYEESIREQQAITQGEEIATTKLDSQKTTGKEIKKLKRGLTGRVPLDKRKMKDKQMLAALDIESEDLYDAVLQYFIRGGKISSKGLGEIIRGKGEVQARIQMVRKESDGGKTRDEIAHEIWQSLDGKEKDIDDDIIKGIVEDVIKENNTPKQMALKLLERHGSKMQEKDGKRYNNSGEELFETPMGYMTQSEIDDYVNYKETLDKVKDEELMQESMQYYENITDEDLEGIDVVDEAFVEAKMAELDSEKSETQKAKEKLDEARASFRKSGGFSTGGLQNLEQFVNLVAAYVNYGYVTAKELVKQLKKDFGHDLKEEEIDDILKIIDSNSILKSEVAKKTPQKEALLASYSDYQSKGGTLAYTDYLKALKSYKLEQNKIAKEQQVQETKEKAERILESKPKTERGKAEKVALKLGLRTQQELNQEVARLIKEYTVKGKLNDIQVKALTKKALGVKFGNQKSQIDFANYFNKVMTKAIDDAKLAQAKLLSEKSKNLAEGFKKGVKDQSILLKEVAKLAKEFSVKGEVTTQKINAILRAASKVRTGNIKSQLNFANYFNKVMNDVEYANRQNRLNELENNKKKVRKNIKSKLGYISNQLNTILNLQDVPNDLIDSYELLINKLAARETVIAVDMQEVQEMYDKVYDILSVQDTMNDVDDSLSDEDKELLKEIDDEIEKIKKEEAIESYEEVSNATDVSTFDFNNDRLTRDAIVFASLPKEFLATLSSTNIKNIAKELNNLANGFISNGLVTSTVLKYNGWVEAQNILDSKNIFGRKGEADTFSDNIKKIQKVAKKLKNKASKRMQQHIDTLTKSIQNTAVYEAIVGKVAQAEGAISENNKLEENNVARLLKKAVDSRGGIMRRFFAATTDNTYRLNATIEFILRQQEHLSNPQDSKTPSIQELFDKIIDNEREIPASDIEVIKSVFEKMKKYEKDGIIDIEQYIDKELNKEEKALLNYIKDGYKRYEQKYVYLANMRGETPKMTNDYSHRSSSMMDSELKSDADSYKMMLGGGVKAGSVNERTSKVPLIKPQGISNYLNYVSDINTDYHLSPIIKEINSTFKTLHKEGGETTKIVSKALQDLTRLNLNSTFIKAKSTTINRKIWRQLTSNVAKKTLIALIRIPQEATNILAATIKIPKLIKYRDAHKSFIKSGALKTIMKEYGTSQNERLDIFGLGGATSDIKQMDVAKTLRKGLKTTDLSKREMVLDLMRNNMMADLGENAMHTYYKMVDALLPASFSVEFLDSFKKITGESFDSDKFMNDKVYRAKNDVNIRRAISKAQKDTSDLYNTASAFEGKVKGKDNPGSLSNVMSNFMQSFAFNEQSTLSSSVKSMFGRGSMTPAEGLVKFSTLTARSMAYDFMGKFIVNTVTNLMVDDEDEEMLDVDQSLKQMGANYLALAIFGNLPAYQKTLLSTGINYAHSFLYKLHFDKEMDDKEKLLYGIDTSRGSDVMKTFGAGGMVMFLGDEIITKGTKILEKIRDGEKVDNKELIELKTYVTLYDAISTTTGVPGLRDFKMLHKRIESKSGVYSKKGATRRKRRRKRTIVQ